jgi:PAS domain-containing protein
MQAMINLFGIKDLIPHGYCLLWSPILLWLHVTSDLLIAFAYYSIPLMLVYFLRKRKDLPYQWLIVMFAGFIVACGTTHLLSAITIWIPLYWLDGLLKGFTAIISVATAVLMLWVIPRVLSLPSAVQLQVEIQQRKVAEDALRLSENKLATVLDNVEAFIYIKDCNYQYQYANEPVRQLFGKALEDIISKPDEAFFDDATTANVHENDRRVIELGERIASENIYTLKDKAAPHTFLTIKQPPLRDRSRVVPRSDSACVFTERERSENSGFTKSRRVIGEHVSHPLVGWRTSDQDGWGLRSNLICRGIFEDFHAGSKGNLYSKIATRCYVVKTAVFTVCAVYPPISLSASRWRKNCAIVMPLTSAYLTR